MTEPNKSEPNKSPFMVEFEKTLSREGGFQCDPHDQANYIAGVCIGTNLGISAQAYHAYFKRVPTQADMKALTKEQAALIFKSNYWDCVAGDYITNDSVAALMFQFIIGSGASQISDIKDIANLTAKKNVLVSNDLPITKPDATFINSLDQAQYHANLKSWRFAFYDRICKATPALEKFHEGWKNRLNGHIFKPTGSL